MSMIGNVGLLTQDEMASLLRQPEAIDRFLNELAADGNPRYGCLDKYWHRIHFLLNRQVWTGEPPLDFIVAGGSPVGDVDVGYGPARVFAPPELARIVDALAALSDDGLRSRAGVASPVQAEIYPSWDIEDVNAYLAICRELQAFLDGGVQQGLGLLIWLD